jgi:type IV pilus assembly protein PilP
MKFFPWLASALFLTFLSGCIGADGEDELREWMEQERQEMRPSVKPLPVPRKFEPFVYDQESHLDPFDVKKLDTALQKVLAASDKANQPDMDRRREPMEAFPLDSISMVGTIVQGGKRVALVRVNQMVYQVKKGEYIGQNFGRITAISETAISINETVQDAAGVWAQRSASLQLQETTK